jgi:hypothetical protein
VSVLRALGRFFSRRGSNARARRLEASGRLEEATAAYLAAGEPAQAARLFVLRADSAPDPIERLRLLGQARQHAGGEAALEIARRRALLAIDLVRAGSLTLVANELGELGRELERVGEPTSAAEAHARAGDREGEARALVAAGAIERLEQVLDAEQERLRRVRVRCELERKILDLELSGQRRAALDLIKTQSSGDEQLGALATQIETRRVLGPRVRLAIDGDPLELVFGERVMVGRAGADLVVASPSVSREHLCVRRGPRGPEVVDQGSRNGTLLGGARIDVPVSVGDGLRLELGGDVPLTVERWGPGVRLVVAGQTLHAPLGRLPVGGWTLALGDDHWLELDTAGSHALLAGLRVDRRIQLCRGDELRERADALPRLAVIE